MKWNVVFPDFKTGRLIYYDIFKDDWFISSMERIMEAGYGKDRFIEELGRAARFWFWAKSEYEFMFTEWPPIIKVSEVVRIVDEYREALDKGEEPSKEIKVYPVNSHKVDIYAQLRINWDHFTEYVWNESRKMINRTTIIGHKLDDDCYRTETTINELGEDDNRILCYGLTKKDSLTEICEKCLQCKAYVHDAKKRERRKNKKRIIFGLIE